MPDQAFIPNGASGQPQQPLPSPQPTQPAPSGGANPREVVALPAILLMVASGLSILLWLAWGTIIVLSFNAGAWKDMPDGQSMVGFVFWAAFSAISIIASIVALYGGWKMKALESHGWALTSAIICLIPCTGACCGLPVGIWALVVLIKPEVKVAFRGPRLG